MQTIFNLVTIVNSLVLIGFIIAIVRSDKEIKEIQEFDSWWESDPNETQESTESQNSAKDPKAIERLIRTHIADYHETKATVAPRKATAPKTKKRSGQVAQPVRKDTRQRKSR